MAQETNNTALVVAHQYTKEQQDLLNQLAKLGKLYQQRAEENYGKWVVAGYAAGESSTLNLYCFCGMGNGYMGAPICPANGSAKTYRTKEQATWRANQLHYTNGHRQPIKLQAMPASEYYWLLHDNTCKAYAEAESLIKSLPK